MTARCNRTKENRFDSRGVLHDRTGRLTFQAPRWPSAVTDITVPVLLLHGREDQFVPFGHGEWLAAHIPGVEARLLDHDGHLTLTEHRVGEVHEWLASHL